MKPGAASANHATVEGSDTAAEDCTQHSVCHPPALCIPQLLNEKLNSTKLRSATPAQPNSRYNSAVYTVELGQFAPAQNRQHENLKDSNK